jgi:pimeloyl-ACP methyl ester carboxylesterase
MPFADNQGVKIYYEVEGQGPPLVFAHGATGDLNVWREYGFVDQFRLDYTVILYDLRGHGQSDKPHDVAAYSYTLLANDVIAVLDTLHLDTTHFWGYSLGAIVGFALAKHHPQHIRSLILGGATPYSRAQPLTEPPWPMLEIMRRGTQDGPDAVVQGFVQLTDVFGKLPPEYEALLRSLDYHAQAALFEYMQYHEPAQEDVLPTMTMPCLIYMAEGDDSDFSFTQEYMTQMPNASFVGLSGYNHGEAMSKPDIIIVEGKTFLTKVAGER